MIVKNLTPRVLSTSPPLSYIKPLKRITLFFGSLCSPVCTPLNKSLKLPINHIELLLSYLSVEVLMSSHYDEKADVFSFGISFFEVLTCMKPYSNNVDKTRNLFVLVQEILKGMRPGPPLTKQKDVMDLITSCWEADPEKRPSIQKVLAILESIIESR